MSAQLAVTAPLPDIDYVALTPILIVFAAALISVVLEALLPRQQRRNAQLIVVSVALVAALVAVFALAGTNVLTAAGSLSIDAPGLFLQGVIVLLGILATFLMAEDRVDPAGDAFTPRASALPGSEDERVFTAQRWAQTEIWPLFLFSLGGMLVFVIANDLLTMFVALEVVSLPVYLLVGMSRRRRLLSQEASLKYFLLGSFGSAFFLYGAALIYGFSGSLQFGQISDALSTIAGPSALAVAGMALLAVGMFFKIGAAPFHQWVPDVYQGAPTPITGFMAAAVKVAAFGALLRLFFVAFGNSNWDWRPAFWIVAVLTMMVGVILALTQNDVKRILAYSSISHAGYLLIGVLAANPFGIGSTLFYLLAYGVSTVGAFALVYLVRDSGGEATSLSSWAGLGRKAPVVASAFALFLLAFAGIPLTSGFTAKFAVFAAGIDGGMTSVVIIAVIASAISVFFYARIIVIMFFTTPPADGGPTVAIPSAFTAATIGIAAALTVLLGIVPEPILDIAQQASQFVR